MPARSTCLRRAFMLYSMLPGCCSHPGHRLAGAANRARLFYWGQKILKETNQKYITTFLNWQIAQFQACVDKHKGALWHYQFGFPTGRPGDGAGPLASAWGIENQGHWVLDTVFGEDCSRARKAHLPQTLSLLRRAVITLLRLFGQEGVTCTRARLSANVDQALSLIGLY